MPELRYLNALDYAVVAGYMIMAVGVGVYVARFNRRTSDYFKGGGQIPWGLAGLSLFISGFSAFMFVGAAGVMYGNGGGGLLLFTLAGPAYLLGFWIYGPLWKRTRIDTPMQFLHRRYSPGTTYFYTLLAVVPNVLILGTSIYILCIFVATALGIGGVSVPVGPYVISGFELCLVVTGLVIVLYTMVGGLWAVMVTDALQFFILLLVTLIVAPAAFMALGDGSLAGGVGRLAREAPEGYFAIDLAGRPPAFWAAYFINILFGYNVNWHIAQRYYSVPDEGDTRKMALWCAFLGVALPLLWLTPVLTTPLLFPDLDALWPELAEPSEAAFVTLAMSILPHGLLGFMVAAILAATMSSVDTTFNWLAAVLTKDVYVPVHERYRGAAPSEGRQLLFGRLSVVVMGLIAIWVALNMDRYGGAFDVYLRADSLYKPAMFVPVFFGLIYTRTPWWSGIAAFGAGVFGVIVAGILAAEQGTFTGWDFSIVFADIRLTVLGVELGRYEVNTLIGVGVSSAVFWGSALWHRRTGVFKARIEALERDLRTPSRRAEGAAADLRGLLAYRLAATLAVGIGVVLVVMSFFTASDDGLLNAMGGALSVTIGVGIFRMVSHLKRSSGDEQPV